MGMWSPVCSCSSPPPQGAGPGPRPRPWGRALTGGGVGGPSGAAAHPAAPTAPNLEDTLPVDAGEDDHSDGGGSLDEGPLQGSDGAFAKNVAKGARSGIKKAARRAKKAIPKVCVKTPIPHVQTAKLLSCSKGYLTVGPLCMHTYNLTFSIAEVGQKIGELQKKAGKVWNLVSGALQKALNAALKAVTKLLHLPDPTKLIPSIALPPAVDFSAKIEGAMDSMLGPFKEVISKVGSGNPLWAEVERMVDDLPGSLSGSAAASLPDSPAAGTGAGVSPSPPASCRFPHHCS